MSDLGPREKRCKDCGELKPASEFWRRKQSPDGLALYCRECFGRRNAAAYRQKQAEAGKSPRSYRRHSATPEGMKYCANCAQTKPISEFGLNRAEPSGRASYCRPCHNAVMAEIKARKHGSVRNYQLKRRYGLTADEVAALRDGQGGFCLICLHRRSLHVDHDHSSGDLRGLLCFRCNGGLGQFKDDPRLMRQAVDYLEDRLLEPYQPQVGVSGSGVRGQRKSWRHYHLVQRYGIGSAEVECLVGLQGGVCPICRKASAAVVDHDHVSGAVRGILCPGCNTGMGQFRDNPWLLRRAIEYLSGGLLGLRAAGDGTYEVAVVRPRGSGPAVDPGWDAGRAATDDLALLHALAHGDSGDPWEDDVDVAPSGPCELRFPPLDLSEPDAGAPPPTGPPHPPGPPSPPECAFS